MKTKTMYILAVIICAVLLASTPAFATIVLEVHSDTFNGDTAFVDSTGNHTLIPNSTAHVCHSTVNPKFGSSSMYFGGSTIAYIPVDDSDAWYLGDGNFSIDLWFRPGQINLTRYLFGQSASDQSDASFRMAFTIWNNVQFFIRDSSENLRYITSTTAITSTTEWHHTAFVRDGDNMILYLDGVAEDSINVAGITARNSTHEFSIGRWGEVVNGTYRGNIDDLYIRKDEVLSPADVTYIYNNGAIMFEASTPITAGVNGLSWDMEYTTPQINLLAELYSNGTYGLNPADVIIGGTTWHYYDTLPDEVGKSAGDAYDYDGNKYIYLGSSGIGETITGAAEWDTITDAAGELGTDWDSADLETLLGLYIAGGGFVEVDGVKWEYYTDLPDQGDHNIGDAYEWNGRKFIFLGSGIGEAPELPNGVAPLVAMLFGFGLIAMRKRQVV